MDGGIATAGSRRHAPIANHGIEAMHDAKSDVALLPTLLTENFD